MIKNEKYKPFTWKMKTNNELHEINEKYEVKNKKTSRQPENVTWSIWTMTWTIELSTLYFVPVLCLVVCMVKNTSSPLFVVFFLPNTMVQWHWRLSWPGANLFIITIWHFSNISILLFIWLTIKYTNIEWIIARLPNLLFKVSIRYNFRTKIVTFLES